MAISVILVSSDSSEEKCDTPDTPPSPNHGHNLLRLPFSPKSLASSGVLCRRVMILALGQPIPHDPYSFIDSSDTLSDSSLDDLSDSSSGYSSSDHSSPALPSIRSSDSVTDLEGYVDESFESSVPRETSLRDDVVVRELEGLMLGLWLRLLIKRKLRRVRGAWLRTMSNTRSGATITREARFLKSSLVLTLAGAGSTDCSVQSLKEMANSLIAIFTITVEQILKPNTGDANLNETMVMNTFMQYVGMRFKKVLRSNGVADLQISLGNGLWVPVSSDPLAFCVNVGDVLQRIPSDESKVHIEVLSVLWGNRLPFPDGSLPLTRKCLKGRGNNNNNNPRPIKVYCFLTVRSR
ncbi:putative reverse transcriptase domain-containing protein [Tanacetum coccineum]